MAAALTKKKQALLPNLGSWQGAWGREDGEGKCLLEETKHQTFATCKFRIHIYNIRVVQKFPS